MTVCVMFDDKGEFVRVCVAEPWDWVEEGWRLEVIPEGYVWNGKAIISMQEAQAEMMSLNLVTPEEI